MTGNIGKYKAFLGVFDSIEFWGPEKTEAEQVGLRARATKFEAQLVKSWLATSKKEVWKATAVKLLDKAPDVSATCQPALWAKVQELVAGK